MNRIATNANKILYSSAILLSVFFNSSVFAVSFEQVCSLPTTINCWGFESEGDLYYYANGQVNESNDSDGFLRNHPNGYNNVIDGNKQSSMGNLIANQSNDAGIWIYPKRDNSYSEFGAGHSLKFTMLSQSGEKASGDFQTPFSRTGSPFNYKFARFGPGGEFWIRWAERDSATFLAGNLRRSNGGKAAPKRLIIHGRDSSGNLEETIDDYQSRNVVHMYSNSGSERYQEPQTLIGCEYMGNDDQANYRAPVQPQCRNFQADTWVVYQVHVKVADNAPNFNNGIVELYINDEPNPVISINNSDMSSLLANLPPYSTDGNWNSGDEEAYGMFTFTLFTTNKDSGQVHDEANMWIDNVVVSHQRVPPITSASGNASTVPVEPTGESITIKK